MFVIIDNNNDNDSENKNIIIIIIIIILSIRFLTIVNILKEKEAYVIVGACYYIPFSLLLGHRTWDWKDCHGGEHYN